jgi:hypothetical protein
VPKPTGLWAICRSRPKAKDRRNVIMNRKKTTVAATTISYIASRNNISKTVHSSDRFSDLRKSENKWFKKVSLRSFAGLI